MTAASKVHRRRPRIRLWHLFALITLAAVGVWLWPKVGLELDHKPGWGSRAAIVWNGKLVELWDTYPDLAPPFPAESIEPRFLSGTIPSPNGSGIE